MGELDTDARVSTAETLSNQVLMPRLKTILRLVFSRLIQLFGNIVKTALFLHFKLFPNARFTLPPYASPLVNKSSPRVVPRIIWQTNYSAHVTLPVYVNYLWNRLLAATHEYRFCDDDTCDAFIREYYPGEVTDAWSRLQIGAAKADFWRILVLHRHGGVYMDVDGALCWPAEWIVNSTQTELLLRNPDNSLTNFFMASTANNPLLESMAKKIVCNIQENTLTSVYEMTGPTVVDSVAENFNVAVERTRLVCRQGQFTSKIFQYPENLNGYWVKEQERTKIIK